MLEQTPISNPLSTNGFSSIDHRDVKGPDSELVTILNTQLADRDATIKNMQFQLEDVKRRSFVKNDTTTPDREAIEETKASK